MFWKPVCVKYQVLSWLLFSSRTWVVCVGGGSEVSALAFVCCFLCARLELWYGEENTRAWHISASFSFFWNAFSLFLRPQLSCWKSSWCSRDLCSPLSSQNWFSYHFALRITTGCLMSWLAVLYAHIPIQWWAKTVLFNSGVLTKPHAQRMHALAGGKEITCTIKTVREIVSTFHCFERFVLSLIKKWEIPRLRDWGGGFPQHFVLISTVALNNRFCCGLC